MRAHLIGGCGCALDLNRLFPPAVLDSISSAEGHLALPALVALVEGAMAQLYFTRLEAAAHQRGNAAERVHSGNGLLLHRRQPAAAASAKAADSGGSGGSGNSSGNGGVGGVQPPCVRVFRTPSCGGSAAISITVQSGTAATEARTMELVELEGRGELGKLTRLIEQTLG